MFSANSDKDKLYDSLFYEPFYQLMRLQLLAQEIEYHREMDADIVTVLHVSPLANKEFRERVTSPELEKIFPQKGVLEVWKELVPQTKFMSISVEGLLDNVVGNIANGQDWPNYLKTRYGWGNH